MITLSLASGVGFAGGSVTLALSIASTGGDACTIIEWDFSYLNLTLVSVTPGAAAASKSLNRTGNRVTVGGFDTNVIPDGILVYVTFNIAAHPSANPIPVTLTAITASDIDANPLTTASSPGAISYSLPFPIPCLSFDLSTGEISGTPCVTGHFCVTYEVTDSLGATAQITCCIDIEGPQGGCIAQSQLSPPPPPPPAASIDCMGVGSLKSQL